MATPSLASFNSFSSIIALIGVSLGTSIKRRFSLRQTAAARVISVSAMPCAIFAMVLSEQGTITIASKRLLPEAIDANMSSSSKTSSAI
jgi:hypothetical protein